MRFNKVFLDGHGDDFVVFVILDDSRQLYFVDSTDDMLEDDEEEIVSPDGFYEDRNLASRFEVRRDVRVRRPGARHAPALRLLSAQDRANLPVYLLQLLDEAVPRARRGPRDAAPTQKLATSHKWRSD